VKAGKNGERGKEKRRQRNTIATKVKYLTKRKKKRGERKE
jgi:hypothetical protein